MNARRSGFTLIELLITVTVMVVLLTLAVVSLRANQATARDEERKGDTTAIAQQLEAYYQSGSDPASSYPRGEYPPTDFLNSESNIRLALRDVDPRNLRAPDVATSSPVSLTIAATASAQTPIESQYIYQPLTAAGAICQTAAQECVKFTLYYKLEGNATIQQIASRNQ